MKSEIVNIPTIGKYENHYKLLRKLKQCFRHKKIPNYDTNLHNLA
jgi:hypothetical protein